MVFLNSSDAPANQRLRNQRSHISTSHFTTNSTTQPYRNPFRKRGARLPGTSTLLCPRWCIFPIQRSTTSSRPQLHAGAAVVGGTFYFCVCSNNEKIED